MHALIKLSAQQKLMSLDIKWSLCILEDLSTQQIILSTLQLVRAKTRTHVKASRKQLRTISTVRRQTSTTSTAIATP